MLLDFSSSIEAVKLNVLPRLFFLFLSLPARIAESQFIAWDKQLSRFIWAGARPKAKGLAVPNLRESTIMLYPVYWCSSDYQARWKHIELNVDQSHPQARLGGAEHTKLKGENSIAEDSLNIWYEIVRKYNLEGEIKLLVWLSHTPGFGPGARDNASASYVLYERVRDIFMTQRLGKDCQQETVEWWKCLPVHINKH